MSRVRILTASTSDVPPAIASRLCTTVVPAYVQMNDHSYRDELLPLTTLRQGSECDSGRLIGRLEELTRALGPLERLAILRSCAPKVEQARHRLADLCPARHLITTLITTIIGAHVGPRGLGAAAITAS